MIFKKLENSTIASIYLKTNFMMPQQKIFHPLIQHSPGVLWWLSCWGKKPTNWIFGVKKALELKANNGSILATVPLLITYMYAYSDLYILVC